MKNLYVKIAIVIVAILLVGVLVWALNRGDKKDDNVEVKVNELFTTLEKAIQGDEEAIGMLSLTPTEIQNEFDLLMPNAELSDFKKDLRKNFNIEVKKVEKNDNAEGQYVVTYSIESYNLNNASKVFVETDKYLTEDELEIYVNGERGSEEQEKVIQKLNAEYKKQVNEMKPNTIEQVSLIRVSSNGNALFVNTEEVKDIIKNIVKK